MAKKKLEKISYFGIVMLALGAALLFVTPAGAAIIAVGSLFFIIGMYEKKKNEKAEAENKLANQHHAGIRAHGQ